MHISDFDYQLPDELIAREPASSRDGSRMMVLDAAENRFLDAQFYELATFLNPSDVLVLNNTRVVRARMSGQLERQTGAIRSIEVFFAEPIAEKVWNVLCRPGRRIRTGDRVVFAHGEAIGVFRGRQDEVLHILEVQSSRSVEDLLQAHGEVPLPPYIDRPASVGDETNYQTVFASKPGAVAAPTAGLHFTERTLQSLRSKK